MFSDTIGLLIIKATQWLSSQGGTTDPFHPLQTSSNAKQNIQREKKEDRAHGLETRELLRRAGHRRETEPREAETGPWALGLKTGSGS